MIFTVERAAFLDAVSRLQRTVGTKSAMPVLEGILISAEQGKVTLASYNLEIGMKKVLYANCSEEGDIVINARILSEILRRMNGVQVEIEADEKLICHIKSGDAVFDIMGMNATDFPEMPSVSEGTDISIDGQLFADMVRGTIFSAAQMEGSRPILTGIDISVTDGVLQLVAIDGYRLAIRRQAVAVSQEIEFIVSARSVGEAVRLISEDTEEISLKVGKRLISFEIDGYVFISRLLEGEFVNYQKTMPGEEKQRVSFNTHDLTSTVERVSLLINDSFTSPIRCMFEENEVTFSCSTTMGRATETVAVSLLGTPFEIGLNSRYLLDVLKVVDDSGIIVRFNGANSGVLISSSDEENDSYLYMIMPMRLKNE